MGKRVERDAYSFRFNPFTLLPEALTTPDIKRTAGNGERNFVCASALTRFPFCPITLEFLPTGLALRSITVSITVAPPVIATSAAATAEASPTAVSSRFGFVHGQIAPTKIFAIKLLDGRSRLFERRHFNKSEAARATGVAVFDYGS